MRAAAFLRSTIESLQCKSKYYGTPIQASHYAFAILLVVVVCNGVFVVHLKTHSVVKQNGDFSGDGREGEPSPAAAVIASPRLAPAIFDGYS